MYIQEGDAQPTQAAGIDVAADRRRPGRRQQASEALLPLLRGKFDAALDPGPESEVRPRVGGQFALGAVIAAALFLVGVVFRFAV